jgi:hypothetical protein
VVGIAATIAAIAAAKRSTSTFISRRDERCRVTKIGASRSSFVRVRRSTIHLRWSAHDRSRARRVQLMMCSCVLKLYRNELVRCPETLWPACAHSALPSYVARIATYEHRSIILNLVPIF